MNYYFFIPLLIFLIDFYFIVFTLSKKKINLTSTSALLLFVVSGFMYAMFFLNWLIPENFFIMWRLRITSVSWLSIGFWYLNFIFSYFRKKINVLFLLIFSLTLPAIIISLFTNLIVSGYTKYFWGAGIVAAPYYKFLMPIVIVTPILYSSIIIIINLFHTKERYLKIQFVHLLVTTFVAIALGFISEYILPYIFNKSFIHLGSMFSIVPVGIIFFIIVKYKLLSIGLEEASSNLFSNMFDGVLIMDNEYNVVQMNESARIIFKLNDPVPRILKIHQLIPDYDTTKKYINHELDQKKYKKYLSLSQSILISNNNEIGKLLIIKDITNQKILDEIWRRYDSIVNMTNDFISLVREDYTYALVNNSFCKAFGISKTEIINKHVGYIRGEKLFTANLKEKLDQCFSGGKLRTVESLQFGKLGHVYLDTSYFPYYDVDNEITHCIIVSHDITRIKKNEELLQKAHDELETKVIERTENLKKAHTEIQQLINSIKSILISTTSNLLITQFNPTASSLFNIDLGKIRGKNLRELKIDWEWEIIEKGINDCKEKKASIRLKEINYKNNEGKKRILGLSINPVIYRDELNGFIIWGADITERKTMEMQLGQAQKLESIGQLAAGIAHEINTPTQYISDNVNFLKDSFANLIKILSAYKESVLSNEDKFDRKTIDELLDLEKETDLKYLTAEIPKSIGESIEGIQRVTKIVKSMREFSHPNTEEKVFIDINKAIESTITISRNEWKYVSEVITDFDENIPLVPCYPGEINQVFLNIIINASQSIEEKQALDLEEKIENRKEERGRITITTEKSGDFAVIRISDTGMGIPDEIKERVFDPFFTTKDVGKGTGQGLAIAYSVVTEKHNGMITFESQEGEGTVFIIKMPLK